ncbi:hypothetical protein BC826DRAFT_149310 [Russula brevipes]|nr:hypothetical protein BC826DRAFT_149310 [Russula brevipes]
MSVGESAAAHAPPILNRGGHPHTSEHAEHGREGPKVVHDWTVRIHAKKYELGQSFSVLVFLGDVPDDAAQWRTCASFVGAHSAFVHAGGEAGYGYGGGGGGGRDSVTEGFVHLNNTIAKRSGLPSFEPSAVRPYLRENLNWRVQGNDRAAVDFERLPSLEVIVISTPLTYEPGTVFPIPGEQVYHRDITHGRPGGAHHAQA